MEAVNALPIASMRSVLVDAVELAGGQRAWSAKTGIQQSIISETINGKREVSEPIINALGYVVQTYCIPMKGQNHV